MNRKVRIPVMALAAVSLLIAVTGCQKLKARDQLNKGVQAYKNAKYEEAIDHFQEAVNDDPKLPMARSYLATAYAQQVVPDLKTPDNLKNANLAISNFQEVLKESPSDLDAMRGIASIYFNVDDYANAKKWQQKVLAADPKDAQAAYTIGSIDWRLAYRNAVKILHENGLQDNGQGNVKLPKKACKTLADENTDLVNEGIGYLQQAIKIRPNYDDAMAYLQLTYRRKADLACGNKQELADAMAQATAWSQKAMDTRRANQEKLNNKAGAGVTGMK